MRAAMMMAATLPPPPPPMAAALLVFCISVGVPVDEVYIRELKMVQYNTSKHLQRLIPVGFASLQNGTYISTYITILLNSLHSCTKTAMGHF